MKTPIYSAHVPEIKEVRCNDIFEFMDLPNEIVVDGCIFTRSNSYNMDGTTFVAHYECYNNMKVPTTLIGIQIQDLELRDRITAVLSQLNGDYETNTSQSYTNFLLNLEKEIERLLTNPQLTWEQIFDLWEDQRIVRDEIVDSYYEQYIP